MSEAQTVSTTVHYYINSFNFLPLNTSFLSVQLDSVCMFNLDHYTAASGVFLTHPLRGKKRTSQREHLVLLSLR